MIENVIQRGTNVQVLDENDRTIGSFQLGSSAWEIEGWGRDFIVVRNGQLIMTLDESGSELGSTCVYEEHRVRGVGGVSFSVQYGNSLLERLDRHCRTIERVGI